MGPNGDMQKGINAVESISLGMEWLRGASLGGLVVKNSPALHELQEMQVHFLGWDDPLEKEMETHSSILAWEIPERSLAGYTPWGHKELDMAKYIYTGRLKGAGSQVA